MRILVLSNTPFLPTTAGNRARINQMVEHLSACGAEVAMLLVADGDPAGWDEVGMCSRLAHFEVASAGALIRVARRAQRRLFGPAITASRAAMGVDDWCPSWFRRRAARLARDWRADVVLVEYVLLSACLELVPRALKVIDTHDLMHRRPSVYAAAGLAPQWFHTSYEEERRGLARADVLLAMHDEDAATLRRMVPGRVVLTVPHGHPVRPQPLAEARPGRLLLVASYNDVNVQGLRWLLASVWPAVRSAVPDAELMVCGNIAEKVRNVPPRVTLRGVVPSLSDEYARARVVVNPVPASTGLQVKTAEALCHGRPVVSTRAGAAGLVGDACGVEVAETEADFAAQVVAALTDDGALERLAAEATAYARRRLSPEAAFAPLVERLLAGA